MKIWKSIKGYVLLFCSIIVTLFLAIIAGKTIYEKAILKKPKKSERWKKINNTTIAMMGPDGKPIKKVRLPLDPETKKQVTVNDIKTAGITKEGKVNVEIKHTATNRRINP